MARPRRRYRPYYGRRRYSPGLERALQHIREAHELSRQLGGTDKDVKEYFFSLRVHELRQVLDRYEAEFGKPAREYAEQTIPKWKSGKTTMSGLVAGRLFSLLPQMMPLKTKYDLAENLWKQYCPTSSSSLVIGADASVDEIVATVARHFDQTVQSYTVPEPLKQRFAWLAQGDVQAYEQLLNHFLELEKSQIAELARGHVTTLLAHIREHGRVTKGVRQTLEIGKHRYELHFDGRAKGIRTGAPSSRSSPERSGLMWVLAIIGVIVLLLLLGRR